MLDKGKNQATVSILKSSGVVSQAIGFLFSQGVAALASYLAMLTDGDRPMREIGFVGLLWAVFLLWYFVSNLMAVRRAAQLSEGDSAQNPLPGGS